MSMLSHNTPPPPCAIVIFGANGDLTKRLIVPALYNLARTGLLPPAPGAGRRRSQQQDQRGMAGGAARNSWPGILAKNGEDAGREAVGPDRALHDFLSGDFEKPDTYTRLARSAGRLDDKKDDLGGNVLFYMAVADRFFATIAGKLGEAGLVDRRKRQRASAA